MAYGFNDDKSKFDLNKILGDFSTVEAGSTASRAYVATDYIIYDGELYMVIDDIAQGASFVINTNIKKASGIIEEMHKWYVISCDLITVTDLTVYMQQIINPMLKLMDLTIDIINNNSSENSLDIVKNLPILTDNRTSGSGRATRSISAEGVMLDGQNFARTGTNLTFYSCDNSGDPSDPTTYTNSRIEYFMRGWYEELHGHILVPYKKLAAAYPFSSAILVS